MTTSQLSVDMNATLALIISFVVYLIVGLAVILATGPPDIYASLSLVFIVPYLVFFYFGRRRRAWAYLGSALLSAILIAVTPLSVSPEMTSLLLWETTFSTLLLALISLEGFKSYLQFRG